MIKPYFVGITGGSGSGKTFFLKSLQAHFTNEEMCLITQDNYYHEKSKQPLDPNGIENFDTPESIDFNRFYNDLLALKDGKSIMLSEYTFNNPVVRPKILTFNPAPIIIVEGIMIYHFEKIRALFDFKIFIDALEVIKLRRRIVRDKEERGYDVEDVLYRYEHHVTPNFNAYIKPRREEVDLIIPNNDGFGNALEAVTAFLKSKIK